MRDSGEAAPGIELPQLGELLTRWTGTDQLKERRRLRLYIQRVPSY